MVVMIVRFPFSITIHQILQETNTSLEEEGEKTVKTKAFKIHEINLMNTLLSHFDQLKSILSINKLIAMKIKGQIHIF